MLSVDYLLEIISSTIRMCSPLLYCGLAAAICAKADIFNISMDGAMLASAFFSIVVNFYTHNVFLSVLAGILASMLVSALVGVLTIKFKASPVVVGIATNVAMGGVTTYLLFSIFNTRGVFTDPSLVGLSKVDIDLLNNIPYLGTILRGLTYIDLLAYASAIILYIFLYKTVIGYRLRALGINGIAAKSLGTKVDTYRFVTITLSGILCGLGGVLLSMGTVTLFIQNITAGRGYIALAANNLGKSHPLGVLASSLFFGLTEALGNFLQNTSVKGQITDSIPYVATIIALIIFAIQKKAAKKNRTKKLLGIN